MRFSRDKHVTGSFLWPGLIVALVLSSTSAAQTTQADLDDYNLSYIYAAVMGSGTYKIKGRRITQLQAQLTWTQREMSETRPGYAWVAPVGVGYDAVKGNHWLDQIFNENLVTASVMPGFSAHIPVNTTWTIKPLGNLGLTRDFTSEETIIMGVLGLHALGKWSFGDNQELRWGGGIRLAGEYQFKSYDSMGFTIVETGIDYRRDTGFDILDRKVNAGAYLIFQHYVPTWKITETPQGDTDLLSITEIGLSLGLRQTRSILGIPINRVRVGYQQGKNFHGWTIGTEFPF